MKFTEADDKTLNYWAARAQGWNVCSFLTGSDRYWTKPFEMGGDEMICSVDNYDPYNNWQQCGELLEEFNMSVGILYGRWCAVAKKSEIQAADNPRRAIVLSICIATYGEEVPNEDM